MKRIVPGIAIGLVLGFAIPAGAHRDAGTSKHLYNHLHNVAHRLMDIETVVWDELPGILNYLSGDGVYEGPIRPGQIKVDPDCVDKYAIFRMDGGNLKLTCEVAAPTTVSPVATTSPAPVPTGSPDQ